MFKRQVLLAIAGFAACLCSSTAAFAGSNDGVAVSPDSIGVSFGDDLHSMSWGPDGEPGDIDLGGGEPDPHGPGTCTSVVPFTVPCQTPDCTSATGGGVACATAGPPQTTTENYYARSFTNGASTTQIRCVTFFVTTFTSTIPVNMEASVYVKTTAGTNIGGLDPDTAATIQLVARKQITLTPPVTTPATVVIDYGACGAHIPANSVFVVEVAQFDDLTLEDPLPGQLRLGVRTTATAPTWLRTRGSCGAAFQNWTDVASIGFATSQIVMNVQGIQGQPAPVGACCFDANGTGTPGGHTCNDLTAQACAAAAGANPFTFTCPATCAGLNPACDQGACCKLDGTCQLLTEVACLALANDFAWRQRVLCADTNCTPPPVNDECTTKSIMPSTATGQVTWNSTNATTSSSTTSACSTTGIHHDAWWEYTVPAPGGRLVLSTAGSSYDPMVAVYVVAGPQAADCTGILNGSIAEVACNDDVIPGVNQASYLYVDVTTGQIIKVRVGGFDEGINGAGILRWELLPTIGVSGRCCYWDSDGADNTFGTADDNVAVNGPCGQPCCTTDEATCTANPNGHFQVLTNFYEGQLCTTDLSCPSPDGTEFLAIGCFVIPCPAAGEACFSALNLYNPGADGAPGGGGANADTGILVAGGGFGTDTKVITNRLYYRYTLIPGQDIVIDTCGSSFDTTIEIYGDQCDPVTGQLVNAVDGQPSVTQLTQNDDCNGGGTSFGATGIAGCLAAATLESCLCIDVDGPNPAFASGNTLTIVIGAAGADPGTNFDSLDPVPNDILPQAETVVLHVISTPQCFITCAFPQVCPGDVDLNGTINGLDIQGFVNLLLNPPAGDNANCGKGDLNGDFLTNLADVPLFLKALLGKVSCTPPTIDCVEPDPVSCQLPDQGGHGCDGIIGGTSDLNAAAGFAIADNFSSPEGGIVNHICWWGFYRDFGAATPCNGGAAPADDFRITYYEDNAGLPGAVKATFTSANGLAVTRAATGLQIAGHDEFRYSATHASVLVAANQCVWIEIANDTGASTCFWLWSTAPDADGKSSQDADLNGHTAGEANDFDHAFCVNIETYVNACGNAPCTEVNCVGTSEGVEDPCVGANINEGCDALTPTTPATTSNLGNIATPGVLTFCGTTGTRTFAVNTLPCLVAGDCPGTDTCTGGTCDGGPYLSNDVDWYRFTLAAPSKIQLQVQTETGIQVFLFTNTPATLNCADQPALEGFAVEPNCTSGVCDSGVFGNPEEVFPAGTHWIRVIPTTFTAPCGAEYSVRITTAP